MLILTTIFMIIVAYIVGSISSAILLCKLFRLPDPRLGGSGNPGATNVLRLSNKYLAATVLIFDVLKGALPVWLAYKQGVPPNYLGFVAIAASLGHMYPVFFNFKGGKAVATALGTLFPIGWGVALLLILTWIFVFKKTHYSSLAAIVTVLLAPLYTWLFEPIYTAPVMMISVLIIIRHRSNIVRLIKGQESKVNQSPKVD